MDIVAFYCEHKHHCRWQGFVLHQGLSWGEIPPQWDQWRERHTVECGGRLIALVEADEIGGLQGKIMNIDALIERLQDLAQLQTVVAEQQVKIAQLKALLVVHKDKAEGTYWVWQGDDEDHPESLTCPILIRAADMRSILAENVRLKAKVESEYQRGLEEGSSCQAILEIQGRERFLAELKLEQAAEAKGPDRGQRRNHE